MASHQRLGASIRYVLITLAALIASGIVAGLLIPVVFYIVGAGGQAMDPSAPGDQWIFLGGVAGLAAGGLGAVTTFVLIGGLGLRFATQLTTDSGGPQR